MYRGIAEYVVSLDPDVVSPLNGSSLLRAFGIHPHGSNSLQQSEPARSQPVAKRVAVKRHEPDLDLSDDEILDIVSARLASVIPRATAGKVRAALEEGRAIRWGASMSLSVTLDEALTRARYIQKWFDKLWFQCEHYRADERRYKLMAETYIKGFFAMKYVEPVLERGVEKQLSLSQKMPGFSEVRDVIHDHGIWKDYEAEVRPAREEYRPPTPEEARRMEVEVLKDNPELARLFSPQVRKLAGIKG
jgi:hypothetical protein